MHANRRQYSKQTGQPQLPSNFTSMNKGSFSHLDALLDFITGKLSNKRGCDYFRKIEQYIKNYIL